MNWNNGKSGNGMKIWVDLENSPHVPFFKPIMDELTGHGYTFVITARDCFQVCELADLMHMKYSRVGKHYGKSTILKVVGLLIRSMKIVPIMLWERPGLAVSHGSRTQMLIAALLRIPSISIFDYEHAKAPPGFLRPRWILFPDVIPDGEITFSEDCTFKYPGIKEDVYVPDFKPDPHITEVLGLSDNNIVVTIRPPASEAHYRSPDSEILFQSTMDWLAGHESVRVVMLPRNGSQADRIRAQWPELFRSGKVVIPHEVVDGLNLIWHSDLVISGGGTMNREAAALGVPVYSIFRGKTGAVDRYLAGKGRLVMLETADDVKSKVLLSKRDKPSTADCGNRETLKYIVSVIDKAARTLSKAA